MLVGITYVWGLTWGWLLLGAQLPAAKSDEHKEGVKVAFKLAREYRSNQASFRQCTIRFQVRAPEVASLEEASGEIKKPMLTVAGYYARDGEKQLLSLKADLEELKAVGRRPGATRELPDGGLVYRVLFEPGVVLDDGTRCLAWK